jgi:phosphotransacetylase
MKNPSVASLSFSTSKNNCGVKLPPTQSLKKPVKESGHLLDKIVFGPLAIDVLSIHILKPLYLLSNLSLS